MWERVATRVGILLRFESAAGWHDDEDRLPLCLLRYEQRIELLPLLPPPLRHRRWELLFNTSEHGCSIKSILSRCAGAGPTVILVRDRQGHVFGAFAAESWRQHPEPHFYGNGDSVLLSTWPKGFNSWRWNRESGSRSFQCAAIDFIAFGSGGHFGLWLDKSLSFGSTGRCETYDNEPLTEHRVRGGLDEPHRGDSAFEVLEVQVWGFK